MLRELIGDKLVRIGLLILVVGAAPLIAIIVLADVGLWPDPNPNPIGPGLLFFFSFWPGVITTIVGMVRVTKRHVTSF